LYKTVPGVFIYFQVFFSWLKILQENAIGSHIEEKIGNIILFEKNAYNQPELDFLASQACISSSSVNHFSFIYFKNSSVFVQENQSLYFMMISLLSFLFSVRYSKACSFLNNFL